MDLDDAPPARKPRKPRVGGMRATTQFGLVGLVVLLGAVVINVVFLQDQRHAAPLFEVALTPKDPPRAEAAAPLPAPRPAELAAAAPAAEPRAAEPKGGAAKSADSKAPEARLAEAAPARPRADAIGQVIAGLDPAPARSARPAPPAAARGADPIGGLIRNVGAAPQADDADPAAVRSAQHALMRLGFVVKPDGVFGVSTRQAIEQFERDRHLPVRGVLTAQVQRELARAVAAQAQ